MEITKNTIYLPKRECVRYGNCADCEAYHNSKGKLPHCKREEWHFKPLVLNSLVLFVFALLWNGLVHLVVLKSQNTLLGSTHRADLPDKMWISLIVTLLIAILFTLSFRKWQKKRTLKESILHSLFFGLLIITVVDLNQYVLYEIPFNLILLWMLFGLAEFTSYGILSHYIFKNRTHNM
jgi:hypothetical protein